LEDELNLFKRDVIALSHRTQKVGIRKMSSQSSQAIDPDESKNLASSMGNLESAAIVVASSFFHDKNT